jgi:C1A family cysteine protease
MDKSKSYGYHAIMIYGYNEVGWICQNSWGKNFCGDGHFVYPYEEKLEEAWSLVDSIDAKDIKKTRHSGLLDIFYKIYNLILNYIKGRV